MDTNATNRKAVLWVLVVFLLGIALGALGAYLAAGRVWGARPEGKGRADKRARLVEQLTRELTLTADQQQQLDAILAGTQAKYKAIHEQMTPQFEQARQQGRERIRAILTPEQRPKFEEFLGRIDAERKKKERD